MLFEVAYTGSITDTASSEYAAFAFDANSFGWYVDKTGNMLNDDQYIYNFNQGNWGAPWDSMHTFEGTAWTAPAVVTLDLVRPQLVSAVVVAYGVKTSWSVDAPASLKARGERSRSRLLLESGGTESNLILASHVLAVFL